jgi:hypothetical protein
MSHGIAVSGLDGRIPLNEQGIVHRQEVQHKILKTRIFKISQILGVFLVQPHLRKLRDSFFGNLIGIEKANIFLIATRDSALTEKHQKVIVVYVLFFHHPGPGFQLSFLHERIRLSGLAELPV